MSTVADGGAPKVGADDEEGDDDALTSQYRQLAAAPVEPNPAPAPVAPPPSTNEDGGRQERDSFALFPSDIDLAERQLGPYQLSMEIASGGMGTVYLAEHDIGGLLVPIAVKRIHPHLAKDQNFIDMFADEARIASCINHPYVCRVFDFGRAGDSYYIAMEFLHGESLAAVFRALTAERVTSADHPRFIARIIANLAEGLHAAHIQKNAQGVPLEIVHRDVTLQNLFVLSDGTVRVTDFGVARARVRAHQTDGTRIKGKLSYASPEQINQQDIDRRSDIWSLGVVMWELLTGRRLFRARNEGEAVMKVLQRPIPPPSRFAPAVTPELDAAVLQALSRDPAQRFATARDFSRVLERCLAKMSANVTTLDVEEWLQALSPGARVRADRLAAVARGSVLPAQPALVLPSRAPLSSEIDFEAEPAPAVPSARAPRRFVHLALQVGLILISLVAATIGVTQLLADGSNQSDTGSVSIATTNGDALARLGDRQLGITPLTAELPVGKLTLTLEPVSGGAPVPVTIVVKAGAVVPVSVALPAR